MSASIAITVFRDPPKLSRLLDNMKWAGIPDIPIRVIEDPSPFDDRADMTNRYKSVCMSKSNEFGCDIQLFTSGSWGCMQGAIQTALEVSREQWVIYVPDDVLFTKGALWNEYAGVLAYGREWVGGIQAPYWNAHELVQLGSYRTKEDMYLKPPEVSQNPHWNGHGIPRTYINLNGAGFSINRDLFLAMGGWPRCTWRLDEWAGYQAWTHGMVCLTLPGQPRVHYFGGSTSVEPQGMTFHTEESWKEATGGFSPSECGARTVEIMRKLPGDSFDEVLGFFQRGGKLV